MPFNNYAPQYVFKGQVQSDTAPSANNDLVRKQDVSGLSFISSISGSSSNYLSVDASGALSVSNLLVTDVVVNTTDATLSAYISNSASGDNLGVGDIVILTAPAANLMYIVKSGTGSQASDYEEIQSSLTAAEIVALLTGGTGISISGAGSIAIDFSEFDTDSISEGSSNFYYTEARFNTSLSGKSTGDLSEGSNLYYTDARSRAAVSAGGDLTYNSGTGQFSVTTYKSTDFNTDFLGKSTSHLQEGSNLYYTDARARAAFSSGSGISINGSGQVSQRINADKGLLFDAANNDALALSISSDFAFDPSNGQLLLDVDSDVITEGSSNFYYTEARFTSSFNAKSTSDLSEGSNLYFTNTRSRAAVSAGDGVSYNSGTGVISLNLSTDFTIDGGTGKLLLDVDSDVVTEGSLNLYYTDARSRSALSGGSGISYTSGSGQIAVDNSHFRSLHSSQSFTANVAKTINHALGEKYVQVSVYDSSDNLIHAEVSLTDANNLTVTTSDALTGCTVIVSI